MVKYFRGSFLVAPLLGATVSLGLAMSACSSDNNGGGGTPDGGSGGSETGGTTSGSGGKASGGSGGAKASGGATSTGGSGGATGGTTGSGGKTGGSGGVDTDGGDAGDAADGCKPIESLELPTIPGDSTLIDVPHGVTLIHHYKAVGTQTYECQSTAKAASGPDAGFTYSWSVPFGSQPDALLSDGCGKPAIVHHFALAHAFGKPPLWESLADHTTVQGTKLQSVAKAGTIPWLLLKGSEPSGEDGAVGLLSSVTYIQRLYTAGGAAPAAAGCNGEHVGETKAVDYTADYYFYSGTPNDGG